MTPHDKIDQIIDMALEEDLDELGDVTSNFVVPGDAEGRAEIVAKASGIIAGVKVARRVFDHVDSRVDFAPRVGDGTRVVTGDRVARLVGPLRSILTAERTALNLLQRLSGIATLTAEFVSKVAGTGTIILDTRKTTPGLRTLEKAAVRAGGGQSHRMGLFDMVLIKENHIRAAGGIAPAVRRARAGLQAAALNLKIEVETRNLEEVAEALGLGVDRILLDNMRPDDIREAVKLCAGRVELEASGGVTLENVGPFAETGVGYISIGALTHSAPALDLSLLILE